MSILSDELLNDPLGRGYSTMIDLEAVASLNAVDRNVNKISMTGSEILSQAEPLEYNVLTAEKKAQWLALCGVDSIDPFGSAVQVVIDIWGGGSATIINLQASRVETMSRAQELGLPKVKTYHVTEARV